MKRIYHHYQDWEDYKAGMWRTASYKERAELLPRAIEFTGNADLYGQFMLRVANEWPITCSGDSKRRIQPHGFHYPP